MNGGFPIHGIRRFTKLAQSIGHGLERALTKPNGIDAPERAWLWPRQAGVFWILVRQALLLTETASEKNTIPSPIARTALCNAPTAIQTTAANMKPSDGSRWLHADSALGMRDSRNTTTKVATKGAK